MRVGYRGQGVSGGDRERAIEVGYRFGEEDYGKEDGVGSILWVDASRAPVSPGQGVNDGDDGSSSDSGITNHTCPTIMRYINDPLLPVAYNVQFIKDATSLSPSQWVTVVALREILVGEELFVEYGKGYWTGVKGGMKMKVGELARVYRKVWGGVGEEVTDGWPSLDFRNILELAPPPS